MITLQAIQNSERLLLGAAHDRLKLIAALALRRIRERGEDVEIPTALKEAYDLVKTSQIMLHRGARRDAVDMHLRMLQTQPAQAIAPEPPHTKGSHMSMISAQLGQCNYAPPQAAPNQSPEERIKQAQEALAQAEQAKALEDARKALEARLDHEEAMARATLTLLLCIRRRDFSPQYDFAKFRKELNPLAETYGFKLVLVGDKTRATLTAL